MPAKSPILGAMDETVGARIELRDALESALRHSDGLIDKVLDSLAGRGDKIFGEIVKPNFPPAVQGALGILIAQRQNVKAQFNQRLRECVYQGVGIAKQSAQLMRFEDLKLFDEEDLDESIEIAHCLQEMSSLTEQQQPTLNSMMSTLLGWSTVQAQINPLRPEMYARALRECIAEQVEDADIRSALLPPAAGRLGILLRKLYIELNAWLKASGVELASELPPGQVQSSVAKPVLPTTVGNSVARTLLTLDRLRRLLAGELDGTGVRNPQDFLHTVPASVVALQDMRQVDAMVKRLEAKAKKAAENPDIDAARKRVAARMALTDGKLLGQQLGEEIVRLMLDNLLNDDRLLPQVRQHLQTLEPMLTHIAQTDGRFFNDKEHAARQFLEKITSRSLAFTTERDDGYKEFVRSLADSNSLIAKKTQAGELIALAFGYAMERLDTVWMRQDQEGRLRREEAARALQHAEQRNMLAKFLAQEFRSDAQGLDITQFVLDFVSGPWAQVVAEAQLRSQDGSSDSKGYHALVAELYWSVQPRVARRNRKRLVQIIPGMLGKLRQGLQSIDFPPEKITDFFGQLIDMHEAALEGGRTKTKDTADADSPSTQAPDSTMHSLEEVDEPADLAALYAAANQTGSGTSNTLAAVESTQPVLANTPDSNAPWLGKTEAADAGFVQEIAANSSKNANTAQTQGILPPPAHPLPPLAVGTWIEVTLDNETLRAQMTWASPHRSLYMFVARGGKTHSMSQKTLDSLRSQGLLRIISEGHLVEQALDAVAQTALRNSVEQSKPAP